MHFSSQLLSIFNFLLLICCLVSLKQYFRPGDEIRLPFHIFNLIFIIVFYSISIPFLLNNIEYYSDDKHATPLSILIKFFFGTGISSVFQWIIILTTIVNILYIKKYREDYFNIGIPIDHHKKPAAVAENDEKA